VEDTQKSNDPQSAPVDATSQTNSAASLAATVKPTPKAKPKAKPRAKPVAAAAAALDPAAGTAPPVKVAAVKAIDPERVYLTIASDGTPEGKCDVFTGDGHGGQYLIKRDEEVYVPIGVYNVLRIANSEVYQTDSNDSVVGSRSVPRYNLSIRMA